MFAFTALFLLIFEGDAEITPLNASGMAPSNRVNLSPSEARLEGVVLPPRSPPAGAARGFQHPHAEPSREGPDRARLGERHDIRPEPLWAPGKGNGSGEQEIVEKGKSEEW
ncbi:hypothetical protein P7K49_037280 [Saguinus oedipus]|uniref:Uncharacterized protein n=1 Tax=Saguinus oedipus TaxID=9490 RepID=A0ABQ9TJ65_SAGOE|nr:hypothetical protein P7K49_037280 [Saguinus oedipus]